MTDEDLKMYREMIRAREAALAEAFDALRHNASTRERNNARAVIAEVCPHIEAACT